MIKALAEGRKVCAAASGGQTAGKRYNEAIGRWLRCYGFDRIHKSDRSRLLDALTNSRSSISGGQDGPLRAT